MRMSLCTSTRQSCRLRGIRRPLPLPTDLHIRLINDELNTATRSSQTLF